MRIPPVTWSIALCVAAAFARAQQPNQQPKTPPPAADLDLLSTIPWTTDGVEYYDHAPAPRGKVDRTALVDAAIARAKQEHKLVLWYVQRIVEDKVLQGRQMYRAPVLDVYMQQVVFADPDVAAIATACTVPLRCAMDEPLCQRFSLRPLQFVEPAVVFLDGDGKVVHWVERFRTFHAQWFADLLVRVLDQAGIARDGGGADAQRRGGLWRQALATASAQPDKDAAAWLQIAALQRLLRLPEQALDSLAKAEHDVQSRVAARERDAGGDGGGGRRRGSRGPTPDELRTLGDVLCERGLVLSMTGNLLDAQPALEHAWRSGGTRAAEAGYWYALNALHLGDEVGAMRRFQLVADQHPTEVFGKRARANSKLGLDDRPLGAAFTGFEDVRYLPESAYQGMPKDTAWHGDAQAPKPLARHAVEFLLAQQRDDGGFTDARYAYWPSTEITPNVWVAITAIALTALWEYREVFPDLQPRIDAALRKGEAFAFDPKRLCRGANEDCYSDAYRLMYLARRSSRADEAARRELVQRMNTIVEQAALRQQQSGFFAHEYENAFCTGAVLQELVAARAAGATVPTEMTDKAAAALISARFETGAFVYGGKAQGKPTGLKDAAARMPVCEGTLFQEGRSDLDKVRFALQNFWEHMKNIETVRRNDFHSDGELGGFFFFHAVFHASEVVRLLPEAERAPHWHQFVALLQQVPEMDGSFLDSHELGRSYGTAMALLTLRNAATFE